MSWSPMLQCQHGEDSSRSSRTCWSFCSSSRRPSPPLSGCYERESPLPYEAIAIFAVVLLNAVMGYVQESRAESAVAALRQMAASQAHVIRDGEQPAYTRGRDRARRPHSGRGRRQNTRRCARHSINSPADGRSRTDRRKPSRLEGCSTHLRGGGHRRPPQHGVQRHRRDLRSRPRRGHRDRDADRDGTYRRNAERSAGGNDAAAEGARPSR